MNRLQIFATSSACVAVIAGGTGVLLAASASATPDGLVPHPRGTISGTYGSPASLTCTGPGGAGDLDGDGKADRLVVDALHYSVQAPRDSATGQASGKRQHKPLMVIRKELGASSGGWSKLYRDGTSLSCTLTHHRAIGTYSDGTSRDVTLRMADVTVTDHQIMLGDTRSPDEGGLGMHEEIELTASTMTWSVS
ncbi:MAG: hypothetical protein JWN77_3033 [Frankiales bacterium]|jgi:type VI secretion system secreted protein Hcp|nr:hypothetical protein [Frankiales bacterium]